MYDKKVFLQTDQPLRVKRFEDIIYPRIKYIRGTQQYGQVYSTIITPLTRITDGTHESSIRYQIAARGRLNIKMSSYQYRDSHVKDKTVSPTVLSLTWESPYLGKAVFILRRGPDDDN